MIKRIATVGGWTLVSRISGFIRDVVMAAVLGAGPMADAFFVAFRLPNHFRAIFAEGAFAAAFVPAYARVLQQAGIDPAKLFADRIAAALIAINLVLLSLALLFTPWVVSILAPGLVNDPTRFDMAVALTRITFPYLALVSLETLLAGVLNANQRFAAAAGAPVLLNVSLIATLLLAPYFQSAGYAAAWGVAIAGVAQVLLVAIDAEMRGIGIRFRLPKLDENTRRFLKALGPAIVGAGGVQLALFADTLIASFLPTGALSALYYADRINQLPIGVVGIAVGTVLLPEMSRRLAAGDERGRCSGASARHPIGAADGGPVRGRRHRYPRSHHARAVRPRRLYRCRCSGRRRHARRLRHRASALRHDAELHRALLCPRRHADPGQGSAARRRGQHRAESRADGTAGAGRPCAGDERRRLDQSDAAHHLRPAAGFRRIGRRTSPGDTASACRRRARRRALFWQRLAEQGLRRL